MGHPRDGAERDDDVVVLDLDTAGVRLHRGEAGGLVERDHASEHELRLHICRSGMATWRGSIAPAATSGSNGV